MPNWWDMWFVYKLMVKGWPTVARSFHALTGWPYQMFLFEQKYNLPWTFFISDLHTFSKWFSFLCLGPWTNHVGPVWWSTLRFMFLNDSWCESLIWWRKVVCWFVLFIHAFIHFPSLTYYFPLKLFHSKIFFALSTLYCHIPLTHTLS